jgi:hypothetical protein
VHEPGKNDEGRVNFISFAGQSRFRPGQGICYRNVTIYGLTRSPAANIGNAHEIHPLFFAPESAGGGHDAGIGWSGRGRVLTGIADDERL